MEKKKSKFEQVPEYLKMYDISLDPDALCDNCIYSKTSYSREPLDPPAWFCSNKNHMEAIGEIELEMIDGEIVTLYTCPGFERGD